eukprot:10931492-Lingulodinium_polyedra.AAC.1
MAGACRGASGRPLNEPLPATATAPVIHAMTWPSSATDTALRFTGARWPGGSPRARAGGRRLAASF